MELIATSDLLSMKPIIYAANLDEDTFWRRLPGEPLLPAGPGSWRDKEGPR